jgi:ABC-type transport system involved in cytochrome c biogenesis permease component
MTSQPLLRTAPTLLWIAGTLATLVALVVLG